MTRRGGHMKGKVKQRKEAQYYCESCGFYTYEKDCTRCHNHETVPVKTIKDKIKIVHRGKPVIKSASITEQSKKIVLLNIDCKSKYCDIDYFYNDDDYPGIGITASANSLYLDKRYQSDTTVVTFPQYAGWRVFSATCTRYTCYVTLLRI